LHAAILESAGPRYPPSCIKMPSTASTGFTFERPSATDKVDDKSKDLNNVEAKGAYDVALARVEGNH
jgi:hypothetical protein